MRILVLSNFYPPARPGGYTQWCHEVADGLAQRGHVLGILTSRHEAAKAPSAEREVYRLLHLDGDLDYYQPRHFFTRWPAEHRENLATLERVIQSFAPDVLFVWGMWALSRALPARAEQLLPGRVAYYLSDYWPAAVDMHTAYWRSPSRHWLAHLPKRLLGRVAQARLAQQAHPPLKFERAICVSGRVRALLVEAGLPLQAARIIHGGTAVDRFAAAAARDFHRRPLRLLYAGQLVQHKGVHTAVEAVGLLVNQHGLDHIRLNLVGSGHPAYVAQLHALVERYHLRQHVVFHGPADKSDMPVVMQSSEVLVFPSIYEEPLARTMQEAMASGLLVVGTTTGGSREILKAGETGLTFPPGDANALAEQLARVVSTPDLCARLAQAGRQAVLSHFTLDRMVCEIDTYLRESFAAR